MDLLPHGRPSHSSLHSHVLSAVCGLVGRLTNHLSLILIVLPSLNVLAIILMDGNQLLKCANQIVRIGENHFHGQ